MSRRNSIALCWALVVCLLLGHNAYLWLGKRIVPDTDIMALLPVQKRDPVLQQSFTHMVDAAQQRVIVLLGAKDWTDAKRAADAYSAVLSTKAELLTTTQLTDQTQNDWLAKFQEHSLILLSSEQESQLKTQSPQFWLDSALRNLYSPFSGPKLGAWRDDPFGLFTGWVQERAQETPVRPRDGYLFVANAERQYVLLSLTLKDSVFAMGVQQSVMALLKQANEAAHKTAPDAEIITAGVILHAAAAGEQASNEVFTIGLGSMLGIILLMWVTFHSLKPILLILLSIAIGCLGSLSICWILFERIHLLTLVFGASLIGVAQDYGIYFLCNRLSADAKLSSEALLKRLLPSLSLTLLAAVIGYMGLAFTPFPGLRYMAVFSALGLVFAWLTVICWFPLLISGGTLKSGALVRAYGNTLTRWPRLKANKITIFIGLIFVLFAAFGVARLGVNDDIRLLQNPPQHLIADQIKLSKLLDAPTPVQFYLVRGATQEIVLQREEALKKQLDPLIVQHKITGYQALSNWVPSAQTQSVRKALLEEKLLNEGGALTQLAQQLGEDADWVAATRTHLLNSGKLLTLDEFLKTPASEPWRHLWLGKVTDDYASIVALRGLSNVNLPLIQHAGDGLDGVQWVDKVAEISSVLGQYRHYMGWVVMCSYLVVFGLLFVRYRRDTWRVIAPAAIASIATLAILGFFNQHLQLFHVLPLMLLLGIGVDYGIFMQEKASVHHATAWLAIGLSAANTLLSFGLLGLSKTPALQSFGLTMLIGIALVWLIVPFFRKENLHGD
ncbi:MMPL family transporter [Solimicrobium silvestre]|uniref:Putative exporter n=1 Tax=Solimicrobium silvestre TaxID=2099400 RepID=A0A2S9H589_9BURK|nr:MMPL family transporter [Solimicrobium silvestre]PRC95149.1 putative exporter [Solimicrobium silvestre]